MLRELLLIWIPLLLIAVAPIAQITFTTLKRLGKINTPFWVINIINFIAGFPLSIAATFVSVMDVPPGIHCATGCTVFVFFGFMITLIGIPLIALFNYLALAVNRNYLRTKA